jgi:cysteine desulfurase
MRRVYLDHSATTPLDERVLQSMQPFFTQTFGNPSSIHAFGREARVALEESREVIAKFLGAEVGEIYFTSGGTESDNHAIKGVAHANLRNGKTHLVTSRAEHHAVLHTCRSLEKEGFEVTYLPVDIYGRVDPDDVKRSLTSRTCLVSIIHANNEVGSLNPIEEIGRIANEHGVLFHSDTVQSFGKLPLNVKALPIDLLSVSGHKIYGPKGIGILYVRKGSTIENLLNGGGQERGRRPGTENVPLAVGLARAVEICREEMNGEVERLGALRDLLLKKLEGRFEGLIVNTHPVHNLPNILSFSFDSKRVEMDGEVLLLSMDLKGVALSNGSACTSGSIEPSHVLLAMGRDERTAAASLRFSLGRGNTEEDINYALDALTEVVEKNAKISSR